MKYLSTRGSQKNLSYNEVLLQGLSHDGGLFVPINWPIFSLNELKEMSKLDYSDLASRIIDKFSGEDISFSNLKKMCSTQPL